ncbi:MAG: hypothetical protein F4057_10010 [Acidobacteria bacterium]|nr:hypothetical protein [Acidobacteriota bacterium]
MRCRRKIKPTNKQLTDTEFAWEYYRAFVFFVANAKFSRPDGSLKPIREWGAAEHFAALCVVRNPETKQIVGVQYANPNRAQRILDRMPEDPPRGWTSFDGHDGPCSGPTVH